jgi:hypothetical protein
MQRKLSCVLLFTYVTGLILTCFAGISNAQSGTTSPSVPQFTIRLVDASTPGITIYTISPYTGENESSYRPPVYDLKMHITVKNQAYPSSSQFSYGVRVKGHFSESWEQGPVESVSPTTAPQDGNGYTELILHAGGYTANAQVDVQVKAVLDSVSSSWSATQTVTIPSVTWPTETTPNFPAETPINNPVDASNQTITNNPQPNGDNWNQLSTVLMIIVVIVVVDGLALSVFLVKKRHKKTA